VEATFILSDDGFGLVLLVELAEWTDPLLMAACVNAVRQLQELGSESM
jgi:hypothetical protein